MGISLFSSGKKGAAKEYYTLECLLYILKNVGLQHSVYVRQAAVSSHNNKNFSPFSRVLAFRLKIFRLSIVPIEKIFLLT